MFSTSIRETAALTAPPVAMVTVSRIAASARLPALQRTQTHRLPHVHTPGVGGRGGLKLNRGPAATVLM